MSGGNSSSATTAAWGACSPWAFAAHFLIILSLLAGLLYVLLAGPRKKKDQKKKKEKYQLIRPPTGTARTVSTLVMGAVLGGLVVAVLYQYKRCGAAAAGG
jgi:hypothetical protein